MLLIAVTIVTLPLLEDSAWSDVVELRRRSDGCRASLRPDCSLVTLGRRPDGSCFNRFESVLVRREDAEDVNFFSDLPPAKTLALPCVFADISYKVHEIFSLRPDQGGFYSLGIDASSGDLDGSQHADGETPIDLSH